MWSTFEKTFDRPTLEEKKKNIYKTFIDDWGHQQPRNF